MRQVDQYGRISVDAGEIPTLLHRGADIGSLNINGSEELDRYNDMCVRFNRPDLKIYPMADIDITPQEYHRERSKKWFYGGDDITEYLMSKVTTEDERNRINKELEYFSEKGLMGMLSGIKEIVDIMRENNVVWGVGRGSSVASYVLYLIGIHRINPMKYGLEMDYE